MSQRFNCEFRDCCCMNYRLHHNNLCFQCNHANIWHSRLSPPDYLSFVSNRQSARTPIYERKNIIIEIFEPCVPPLPESDDDIIFCTNIDILPV